MERKDDNRWTEESICDKWPRDSTPSFTTLMMNIVGNSSSTHPGPPKCPQNRYPKSQNFAIFYLDHFGHFLSFGFCQKSYLLVTDLLSNNAISTSHSPSRIINLIDGGHSGIGISEPSESDSDSEPLRAADQWLTALTWHFFFNFLKAHLHCYPGRTCTTILCK